MHNILQKGTYLNHFEVIVFCIILVFLILIAGFFSCAETGLMAVNRYRLKHKALLKKRSALLILKLLKRPDRVLGLILIINTSSAIFASSIATLIAIHFWGEKGVFISTLILTFILLVFTEVAPKTLAALYSERVATLVAWPVFILLKIFYPVVWFVNAIANSVLRLFQIKLRSSGIDPLSREELRSVVYEMAGRVSHQYQSMLLSILDLNKVTVEDVMIPRHAIQGIDIELSWDLVQEKILTIDHDWIPVYRENINNIIGVFHVRDLTKELIKKNILTREILLGLIHETYFIPIGTPLNIQLINFQRQHKRLALVVDEYGEILGLLTLKDIVEEIVGEFTSSVSSATKILAQPDGSYLVDGITTIRDFNRLTHWDLPIDGPKTVNGLITEYLETIPQPNICLKIADYPIEIMEVSDNRVKTACIFPRWVMEELNTPTE